MVIYLFDVLSDILISFLRMLVLNVIENTDTVKKDIEIRFFRLIIMKKRRHY